VVPFKGQISRVGKAVSVDKTPGPLIAFMVVSPGIVRCSIEFAANLSYKASQTLLMLGPDEQAGLEAVVFASLVFAVYTVSLGTERSESLGQPAICAALSLDE
jgi:hypothetical protein